MKRGYVMTAALLIVIGIVLFGIAFAASGFDFSKADGAKYVNRTYTAEGSFTAIDIQEGTADIWFMPSENGEMRVECTEHEETSHEVCVENGTLKIIFKDERPWYKRMTLFSFRHGNVTVYLPLESYETLSVLATTGDVTVTWPFSFGDMRIKTTTGDIFADGIKADSMSLTVTTGSVECKKLDCADKLYVHVTTGKISLTDVTGGEIKCESTTGRINLKNALASGRLDIETTTGSVLLEDCDAAQIAVKTTTGSITGTLKSEKVFSAKTSTGKIDVPGTLSGGECTLKTTTGDISVKLSDQ